MISRHSRRVTRIFMLMLATISWIACNKSNNDAVSASSGKIPITTGSEEARKEFLAGRDLSERLLGQESLQHFDKALNLDGNFAFAELARAANSPTPKEFFEHLNKAVGLADKASQGEKLMILATLAGANGDTVKQEVYLDQLVAAYPNDERAQFNLANYYFGQQELEQAIAHYKKATELAPSYSPAYNVLGYAYRQQGDYADAEQAFQKYIALIPQDPNPYDSYAELLLKMGRFEDSVAQYHKALSIDPHFVPSHFGISANYIYLGKHDEANSELQKMADQARNDGELRTAYLGMAVVAADRGKLEDAVHAVEQQYAVAEKKNDIAAMAGDLQAKGNILVQMQKYDAAGEQFERALQIVEASSLSAEIKSNAKLAHDFNLAGLAIARKDYTAAHTHMEEFRQGAQGSKNPAQIKQAHELAGRLALAQKHYDEAIAELAQANQQDPQNLYRLSQAYRGKGDAAKSHEFMKKAAEFNSLPQLNYAFIRARAEKETAAQKS